MIPDACSQSQSFSPSLSSPFLHPISSFPVFHSQTCIPIFHYHFIIPSPSFPVFHSHSFIPRFAFLFLHPQSFIPSLSFPFFYSHFSFSVFHSHFSFPFLHSHSFIPSIVHYYSLLYISVSSGEEHLEKLLEMERLLIEAGGDQLGLLDEVTTNVHVHGSYTNSEMTRKLMQNRLKLT